jgi:putative hydrolase of the HAD superfamily
MIKAITLDCWGTLFLDSPWSDERYAVERLEGIESVLAAAGIAVGRNVLHHAYDAGGRRLGRLWSECRDVSVREHVWMLLEAVDPDLPAGLEPASIDAMVDAYARPALLAPPAVDPGAAAALESLAARGIALGVVSNTMRTPGVVLRRILDRFGLLGLFKTLSFSDECGIRKPDPRIFQFALSRVGTFPGDAVHVGDDPVLDVRGARDAGMATVQVSAAGRARGAVEPDAVIAGLTELPGAIALLER